MLREGNPPMTSISRCHVALLRWTLRIMLALGPSGVAGAQAVVPGTLALRIPAGSESSDLLGRVVSATRLSDGSIVVADADANALKRFDARGVLRNTIGRRGRGPGEWEMLSWMGQCGRDTLFAIDEFSRRVSVVTPGGQFIREFRVRQRPVWCSTAGLLASLAAPSVPRDGTQFAVARTRIETLTTTGEVLGVSDSVDMYDAAWLDQFPAARPLGRMIGVAVRGNEVLVASHAGTSLVTLSRTGAPVRSISLSEQRNRPTRAQFDRAVEDFLLLVPPGTARDGMRTKLSGIPMPSALPAHFGVFDGGASGWWLQISPPGQSPTRLAAYAPDGSRRAIIELPGGVAVLEAGPGYLLGREESPDGEHSVVLFRIP